ncbi:Stk1 family PASTA domain-containing Ser/Thr kinase [Longispora fulva]|uniref:non-specific serine/threonine protein kinase n=1 Tax=Longispora fulva TaxID=619741 RepID=A0A8J7GJZ9_9ACTN|nr:Stk1 family PASTA domain-containing Ser/Thr kinase [Longispora fulva]MBG6138217.1 serine/threonine-protein kinase [Longispora fulva]
MDTTVADPLIGALLDERYRIRGRVARGGMATVYHAVDERLERTIAIKIIHPTHAGKRQFTDRFEREAKMIARLTHPNIVAVYDEGSHDGLPYLVMEYVKGRTLRDVLNDRVRLAADEALGIMASVLAALAAAHRAGLVHRDVKPENVLLSDDGQVKVADFGLARAVEASGEENTASGQLLATVAYVAPELVSEGYADPRADVYSAGIMLYELLTGHVPYEGAQAVDVAWQHVERDVPAPSRTVPEISAGLDELVARATRRDPGARPTDAGALLAELSAAREDLGAPRPAVARHHPVPPPTAPPLANTAFTALIPMARRVARRPPFAVIAAVVVIGLLVALGGWWFGAGRYTETPALINLVQADAQARAAKAGFSLKAVEGFSETAPVGTVVAQRPKATESILRGGTIVVTVSKGPERHTVPADIIGMDADEAMKALAGQTFKVTRSQGYSATVAAGKVTAVDPPAGAVLPAGASVGVVVSKGPPPITVPSVVGKKVEDAKRELEKLGLVVRTTVVNNDQVAKDKVVGQDPVSGTGVEANATVTLSVSAGPPVVAVPDVGGMTFDEAKKTLESVGLVAVKAFNWPGGRNTVYTQSPGANQQVMKGSTVSLWLY